MQTVFGIVVFVILLVLPLFLDWRSCLKTALILVIFEGVFRKWFFPQLSSPFFILKELVLIITYVKFLFSPHPATNHSERWTALKGIVFVFVAFVCLQVVNLHADSIFITLFGIKVFLLYIPLLFLVQFLFVSKADLYLSLRRYLLFVPPLVLIGVVQFNSSASSFWNLAVGEFGTTSGPMIDATHVRVSSTFPHLTSFVTFLLVGFALSMALFVVEKTKGWRVFFGSSMALSILGVIMAGSRYGVVMMAIILIIFLLLSGAERKMYVVKQLSFAAVVFAVVFPLLFTDQVSAMKHRLMDTSDASERIEWYFVIPVNYFVHAKLFGEGIGSTHRAAKRIRAELGIEEPERGSEREPMRVLLEVGTIGFLLWYALKVFIAISMWFVRIKLRSPFLRELSVAILAFLIIAIPTDTTFQAVGSFYFWFLAGFIFLLPRLDLHEGPKG